MEYRETGMQGEFPEASYADLPHGVREAGQYDEMQRMLWMDGAAALAKANATLAHENMFLRAMQENARLAHENKMLREANVYRMQALAPPGALGPPGLQQDTGPGWAGDPRAPPTYSSRSGSRQSSSREGLGGWMIHDCKGRKSAYLDRLKNSRKESDSSSTAAGSSQRGSLQMSAAASSQRGSVQMSAAPSSRSSQRSSLAMSPELSSKRGSLQMSAASSSQRGSLQMSAADSSHEESLPTPMPGTDDDQEELGADHQGPVTSAMMRNLPNDYTRTMLLDLLRTEGFEGTFDFVYLPHDFRSCSGLGYAFVNFNNLESAKQFREDFTGFNRWAVASDKVCEVTWSSLQGLEAHIERYRNSPVMHESIPEEQKPALFEGVDAVPFPPPTKKIRLPRHWHRRR